MKTISEIHCYREAGAVWKTDCAAAVPGVHIHKFTINEFTHLIGQHAALIKADEAEKSNRFYHREDAQRYLLSRILCRLLLAKYNALLPQDIEFQKGRFDKPYIKHGEGMLLPFFNWSHAQNILLIAFGNSELGVDVEQIRDFDVEAVAGVTFNKAEQKFLSEGEMDLEDFFRLWTRKEAAVKAVGFGLNEELRLFPVLDGPNHLEDTGAGDGIILQNTSLLVDEEYAASICYAADGPLALHYFSLSPEEFIISA
ncbi:MAG: 4'-phosphopantetheinyl transferase superfamily protein [Chitinophagaceae bacterium]|nr:4'-phosphopantetheinyl transferase superfamily protein [Chitinophagaceae bacterium]